VGVGGVVEVDADFEDGVAGYAEVAADGRHDWEEGRRLGGGREGGGSRRVEGFRKEEEGRVYIGWDTKGILPSIKGLVILFCQDQNSSLPKLPNEWNHRKHGSRATRLGSSLQLTVH